MRVELDQSSIVEANSQFWEQMLGTTLEPIVAPGELCVDAGHVRAAVNLSGAWCGWIEVRLARALADWATAAMLQQPLDTVGEADTLDATKEIANMIAGVIKSALPRPCTMTVPESELSEMQFCSPARTGDSVAVAFRHPTGDLVVRVAEL